MTTISVLGSGSVEFGRSLVADLLTSPQLAGARLVLHDIDDERLDTSYRIARATAAAVGSDSVIDAAPELGTALEGADYVVNQINVGGFAATRLDFGIPHRYGVRQTLSDTLGIGGIFRGLRTIPVVLGIAAEMQKRCPHHAIPVGAYLGWFQEGLDEYDEVRRRLDDGEDVTVEPGQELATSFIEALEGGPPRVLPGNVRNDGLIDNVLDGACVEVPCLVDRNGVQPTHVGALPPQLAAVNSAFLNVSELVVLAALDGSREHVYHAAMLGPSTSATLTLDATVELCDEMIAAHGAALPQGVRDQ